MKESLQRLAASVADRTRGGVPPSVARWLWSLQRLAASVADRTTTTKRRTDMDVIDKSSTPSGFRR